MSLEITSSEIDLFHEVLDPEVWDSSMGDPVLVSGLKQIFQRELESLSQTLEFDLGYLKGLYLIGSETTRRWKQSGDLDISVVLSLPTERINDLNQKAIKVRAFNFGKHPINYHFVNSMDFLNVADSVYNIDTDEWVKTEFDVDSPERSQGIVAALKLAEQWATKFDLKIGEINRNLATYETLLDQLTGLRPSDLKSAQEILEEKSDEIHNELQQIIDFYETIKDDRYKALHAAAEEHGEQGIRDFHKANLLPENLVYKFMERWRYLDLVKDIKNILGDSEE